MSGQPLSFLRIQSDDLRALPGRSAVSAGSIHVYAFSLSASPDVERCCLQWLSRPEHERADRFRFEQDRRHYIVAHGYLRHLLSGYCERDPRSLKFEEMPGGKPVLARGLGDADSVRFSLTHSHGCALVAVSSLEVGVDLEPVRADVDHLGLAERFFSVREREAIKALTGEAQRIEFFRHWVAKEAVLKSSGTGLRFPLDECEVRFTDYCTAIANWNADRQASATMTARFLPVEEGWVGAVAAVGGDWRIEVCT